VRCRDRPSSRRDPRRTGESAVNWRAGCAAPQNARSHAQGGTPEHDPPYRVKLFRLAFDAAVSSFSGRQQLYERYYSGDPVRLAGALYTLYDKDPHTSRIAQLLEDLENCARRGRE
jgi:aromatic ring hydroxylase